MKGYLLEGRSRHYNMTVAFNLENYEVAFRRREVNASDEIHAAMEIKGICRGDVEHCHASRVISIEIVECTDMGPAFNYLPGGDEVSL
jgi:hypothetical protein